MIEPCPACGKPHRGKTRRCSIVHESVADLAVSWLDTIHAETLRDEPDCAGRVRLLLGCAAAHIRVRDSA